MAKIFVGCKLPHGLLCEVPTDDPNKPKTFKLNGQWKDLGPNVPALLQPCGITQVDEGLYQAWLALNSESDAVKGGFVFIDKTADKVAAEAEERSDLKNGLEQQDATVPGANVEALKTDD